MRLRRAIRPRSGRSYAFRCAKPTFVVSSFSTFQSGGTMRKFVALAFALAVLLAAGVFVAQQPAAPSPWAYGFDGPAPAAPPPPAGGGGRGAGPAAAPDTSLHQLP